jgi:hypothetical protein
MGINLSFKKHWQYYNRILLSFVFRKGVQISIVELMHDIRLEMDGHSIDVIMLIWVRRIGRRLRL